jgi:lycopene cyclase domain-containing protein
LDRFQYLIVMAACVVLTLPLEFLFGARVWRRPKRLARAVLPPLVVFTAWDMWASARGTWDFADRYTIGIRLPGGMVVEELAFFTVVPVCALLTLEAVRNLLAGSTPLQRWLGER